MVNGNKGNPPSVDGNEYKEDEKRKPEKKNKICPRSFIPDSSGFLLAKFMESATTAGSVITELCYWGHGMYQDHEQWETDTSRGCRPSFIKMIPSFF